MSAGVESVIKLETFPFTCYGPIPGRVVTAARALLDQPQKSPSPDSGEGRGEGASAASPSYSPRIAFDRATLTVDAKTVNPTPDMAATVEIRTGKRKPTAFELSPLSKMAGEAGWEGW